MDIASAILAINPDAQVSVNAEDYDQITCQQILRKSKTNTQRLRGINNGFYN